MTSLLRQLFRLEAVLGVPCREMLDIFMYPQLAGLYKILKTARNQSVIAFSAMNTFPQTTYLNQRAQN